VYSKDVLPEMYVPTPQSNRNGLAISEGHIQDNLTNRCHEATAYTIKSQMCEPSSNTTRVNPGHGTNTRLSKLLRCAKCKSKSSSPGTVLVHFNLLKNARFVLFCVSIMMATISFTSTFIFIPAQITTRGMTVMQAAYILAISGVADTMSRVGTGFLLDRKPFKKWRPQIFNGIFFAFGGLMFVVPFLTSFVEFVIFTIMNGTLFGALLGQKTVILADIVGVKNLSASVGILIWFQGIGCLLGAPLSGNGCTVVSSKCIYKYAHTQN
jgi:hypothetical protein